MTTKKDGLTADSGLDFFISHAGHDRAWAEWVAWHLHEAGYRVELDSWDWGAGDNFVTKMRDGLDRAGRVLALFSPAYFEPSRYTTDEWSAAMIKDRDDNNRLVPVRVESCEVPSLLRPLISSDLFNVSEDEALRRLLAAARGPTGPGGRPAFPPGETTDTRDEATGSGPRLPGSLPRIWNIQQRNPAFVGRDSALVDVREQLLSSGTAVAQALHGIGGVGKTQLAVEYAYRFAGSYELVWWIAAERPELVDAQLANLATQTSTAGATTEVSIAVRALHADLRHRERWLLIFDNAEDPLELQQWLPGGPGHVLITSRNPSWGEVAAPIDVSVFVAEESVALLRRRVPGITESGAERIAAELGNLPLALAQAAGVLSETGLPVDAYLSHLGGHAADALAEGSTGSHRSLATTVADADARLAEADPAAGVLLRLCASLGPEPIPAMLFTAAAVNLPNPVPAIATNPFTLHQALGRISRYGLARLDQDGIQVHRLVQAILRDQLTPAQRQADRECIVALLVISGPTDTDDPANWPMWANLLPHILAANSADSDNAELRGLAARALLYLLRRGDYATAAQLAEMLFQQWTGQLGPDNVHTLAAAREFVHARLKLGHAAEARDLIEDTLARCQRVLGVDHPDTLRSASNLAGTLAELGEFGLARKVSEDTLAGCRRVHGDDHPDTLNAAINFAGNLCELGELGPARKLAEETMARWQSAEGDDHPGTLRAARALASVLDHLGELGPACKLSEDTVTRYQRVQGADHPETLNAARGLANALDQLGELGAARKLLEDTLARSRRVQGEDHPETLRAASSLAVLLFKCDNRFRARKLAEEALTACRRTLGEEHPATRHAKVVFYEIVSAMGGRANASPAKPRKKKKKKKRP